MDARIGHAYIKPALIELRGWSCRHSKTHRKNKNDGTEAHEGLLLIES